jgi:hypothetical protein
VSYDLFRMTTWLGRETLSPPSSLGLSLLGGACALLVAIPAAAQGPEPLPADPTMPALSAPPTTMGLSAPPDDAAAASEGNGDSEANQFGAMLDVGLPDGTMASFVFRPISLLRLHAGVGYNAVSPGFRIGAALLPFGSGPSVSLDYGHYFEGDANGIAGTLTGTNEADSVLLERFGYDFVNLRAGMEIGGDTFVFFTRGGVSWVRTTIHEFATLLDSGNNSANENTSIVVTKDPILSAFVPSFQLGMIVRF